MVIKLHMAETLEAFKSVFKRLSDPRTLQTLGGAPCPWSSNTAT